MGNYFNELRWKIIRANNLLQFIHQVTIEIRFLRTGEWLSSNYAFNFQFVVFPDRSHLLFLILSIDFKQALDSVESKATESKACLKSIESVKIVSEYDQ